MQQGKAGTPFVYFVFDLLEVEGEPLVDLPLTERRERLAELLDRRKAASSSPRPSTTARRSRAAKQQGSRGSWPSGRLAATPGGARATG